MLDADVLKAMNAVRDACRPSDAPPVTCRVCGSGVAKQHADRVCRVCRREQLADALRDAGIEDAERLSEDFVEIQSGLIRWVCSVERAGGR